MRLYPKGKSRGELVFSFKNIEKNFYKVMSEIMRHNSQNQDPCQSSSAKRNLRFPLIILLKNLREIATKKFHKLILKLFLNDSSAAHI